MMRYNFCIALDQARLSGSITKMLAKFQNDTKSVTSDLKASEVSKRDPVKILLLYMNVNRQPYEKKTAWNLSALEMIDWQI